MQTKALRSTVSAMALALGVTAGSAVQAEADPLEKLFGDSWYVSVFGGGAFNERAKGSFLEAGPERRVETVALNLLLGAATLSRVQTLRAQGVVLDPEVARFAPRPLDELKELLN